MGALGSIILAISYRAFTWEKLRNRFIERQEQQLWFAFSLWAHGHFRLCFLISEGNH